MISLQLELNGAKITCDVEPRETLADFLRERCRLTATHLGCEHGACGACTVAVDGQATRSCLPYRYPLLLPPCLPPEILNCVAASLDPLRHNRLASAPADCEIFS